MTRHNMFEKIKEIRKKIFLKKLKRMIGKDRADVFNNAPNYIKKDADVLDEYCSQIRFKDIKRESIEIQETHFLRHGKMYLLDYDDAIIIKYFSQQYQKEEIIDKMLQENKLDILFKNPENLKAFLKLKAQYVCDILKKTDSNTRSSIINKINNISDLQMLVKENVIIPYDKLKIVINNSDLNKELFEYVANNYSNEILTELIISDKINKDNIVDFIDSFIKKYPQDELNEILDFLWNKKKYSFQIRRDSLGKYSVSKEEQSWFLSTGKNNVDCYSYIDQDLYVDQIKKIYENNDEIISLINRLYSLKNLNDIDNNGYIKYTFNRYLKLFINESDFVKKCDADKLTQYVRNDIRMKLNSYKNLLEKNLKRMGSNPIYKEQFVELIEGVYGEKSASLLRQRPGLCEFDNIENIELLSPQVLNNFRDGFVQDLFSYNFKDVNVFLSCIKNDRELKLFKEHYTYLAKIYGENCETMEKAFSSYLNYRDFLIDLEKHPIEDKDNENFVGLYCSNNVIGIKKASDLEKVPSLLFEYIQSIRVNGDEMRNLFNIKYMNEELCALHNVNVDDYKSLTETEKKFLMLWSAFKINKITEQDIIPYMLVSSKAVQKVKKEQSAKVFDKFISMQKLQAAIENHTDNVTMVNVSDMDVVFLGDLEGKVLGHIVNANTCLAPFITTGSGNVCGSNFGKFKNPGDAYISYDGYDGLSTISCGMHSNIYNQNLMYCYLTIENKDIVAFSDRDAGVSHRPKLLETFAAQKSNIDGRSVDGAQFGGEVAFYRRERDHEKIESNKTVDGRIMPDAAVVNSDYDNLAMLISNFGNKVMLLMPGYASEERIKDVEESINRAKRLVLEKQEMTKQDDLIAEIEYKNAGFSK